MIHNERVNYLFFLFISNLFVNLMQIYCDSIVIFKFYPFELKSINYES